MARRFGDKTPGSRASRPTDGSALERSPSRVDRLVELVDHCTLAQTAADQMGERLLSYILSMAIQESRIAIKREARARPPDMI